MSISKSSCRAVLRTTPIKIVNVNTLETKIVCKVRGITLNYTAAQLVNFDSISVDDRDVITVRTDKKIKHKTKESAVQTRRL